MSFVVRAFDRFGTVGWISQPNQLGGRSLTNRLWAEVFPLKAAAEAAIFKIPGIVKDVGTQYVVENSDQPAPL